MSQFGELYAQYYDLLYSEKNYEGEVSYIEELIRSYSTKSSSILDLGCGTGKHAQLLCDKGFNVHGVDLSQEMLAVAEQRRQGREGALKFTHSSIQNLKLESKFDVVISLFHVMSYQNSQEKLHAAFDVVKKHLKNGGIFIFDFWYGPAVLTDLPATRVKRLESEFLKITRIAEPVLYAQDNVVDVNYDIFIEDKSTNQIVNKKELHKMRYFFDTELELICKEFGFKIEKKYEWLNKKTPDFNSWNVVWLLKN
ncbi:class I SAM-dependent DNA methyltransferase [Psychromonas ossibalaenae]|uniref:class I SAM-dependent DNA methyltransferase n=1 Tax=Psychromonas ossibalaenae TaxID=444922 RepID=UPI00037A36E2|nr:class I SAM-dependent methyltransferase [Psychromonas ossibalaenae]